MLGWKIFSVYNYVQVPQGDFLVSYHCSATNKRPHGDQSQASDTEKRRRVAVDGDGSIDDAIYEHYIGKYTQLDYTCSLIVWFLYMLAYSSFHVMCTGQFQLPIKCLVEPSKSRLVRKPNPEFIKLLKTEMVKSPTSDVASIVAIVQLKELVKGSSSIVSVQKCISTRMSMATTLSVPCRSFSARRITS